MAANKESVVSKVSRGGIKRKFVAVEDDMSHGFADLSAYQSTFDIKSFELARVEENKVTNKKAYVYMCFCGKQCKMNTTNFKCATNSCGWSMDKASALYLQEKQLFRKVKAHNIPLCKMCSAVKLMIPLSSSWYSYGIPTYVCGCRKSETMYFSVDKKGLESLAANFHIDKVLSLVPNKKKKTTTTTDESVDNVLPVFGEANLAADDDDKAKTESINSDADEESEEEEEEEANE